MCKGVRQGCTLLSWLFNVYRQGGEGRGEWVREVTMSAGKIGTVMFADDMVMMVEMKEALEDNMQVMNEALIR